MCPQQNKPVYAENGDGCAAVSTKCLLRSIISPLILVYRRQSRSADRTSGRGHDRNLMPQVFSQNASA